MLAAAAYNAGAGNANKWIAAFGDPRADNVDPVVWVELIPFQETRKYVQRVLGNYLVYRARLGDDEMTHRAKRCARIPALTALPVGALLRLSAWPRRVAPADHPAVRRPARDR